MGTSFVVNVGFTLEVAVSDTVILYFDGDPDGPINMGGIPIDNDGVKICTITAVTGSGAPYMQPITVTGDEANKFTLTNGGVCPCDLVIGAADLAAGVHAGTWTFRAPAP